MFLSYTPGRLTLGFEPAIASCCACRGQTACSASTEGFQRSAAVGSACLDCWTGLQSQDKRRVYLFMCVQVSEYITRWACGQWAVPFPRLPGLTPRGLDTLGLVPPAVVVLPVVLAPLSEGFEEFGGPQGFGRGSRFSVRDGCTPDSEPPPRAENGLLPN